MGIPVGPPPGQKLEFEFTAGVWTDVTADLEYAYQGPLATSFGRTSPHAQPGPATLTVTLRNELGRYTPGRQVLADGVTAHPYWPNVLPRKRVRYSYTISGTTYYRFTGYIKGWPPALQSGARPYVTVTATTRDDQLSRGDLQSPIQQVTTQDDPVLWWPLTEAADSTSAAEQSGNVGPPLGLTGSGTALLFGDNGPGFGDGTGVKVAAGQYLSTVSPRTLFTGAAAWSFEVWAQTTAHTDQVALSFSDTIASNFIGNVFIGGASDGKPVYSGSGAAGGTIGPASVVDGGWHHFAVTYNPSGTLLTFYVDGVSAGTDPGGITAASGPNLIRVGQASASSVSTLLNGNVGQVAVYTTVLSAARVAEHFAAGRGYVGDTTGQRVARYLGYGALTAADWTLNTGAAVVGTYPTAGKSIVQACQDMATTENGVFWVDPGGKVRFDDRRARDAITPVLTLDASIPALLDPAAYSPAFDDATLINTSTVSRSAESGTLSTQTYTNPVSVGLYGPSPGDVTTYTKSDQDAINLAQAQVAGNAYPAFRLGQVTVNMHAATTSLYAALAAVQIGTRIRITNLLPTVSPTPTLDLFVEGWAEAVDSATYRVVFDTSPADNPPSMILNDVDRGRLQCDGQTLNAALTNAATTVVIATAAGKPTFTTVGARYPLNIKIGEEVIRLNTAPGGSSSPQTFTAVSRGQQGTTAAAQASGSVINLWPAAALAL